MCVCVCVLIMIFRVALGERFEAVSVSTTNDDRWNVVGTNACPSFRHQTSSMLIHNT